MPVNFSDIVKGPSHFGWQHKLGRLIRIATFGDSTANVAKLINQLDQESSAIPFPVSGNSVGGIQYNKAGCAILLPSIVVASGGVSGETTSQFIARSGLAYSPTRRSVFDVIQKKPDVVLYHGGSVNDVTGFDETTPESTILSVAERHNKCARLFIQNGIHVIDSGILGYDGNGSVPENKLAAIRAAIVLINNAIKAEASKHPEYWHFVDVDGIISSDGAFLPNMTTDGTHPNYYSAKYFADLEVEKISNLYEGSYAGLECLYDGSYDFANAVSEEPLNHALAYTPGVTIVGKTSSIDGMTVSINVASTSASVSWYMNKPCFSDALSGDTLIIKSGFELLDGDGNPVPYQSGWRTQFKNTDNTLGIYYEQGSILRDGDYNVNIQTSTPVDYSSLGSSTLSYYTLSDISPGSYVLKIKPTFIYRHTVLN